MEIKGQNRRLLIFDKNLLYNMDIMVDQMNLEPGRVLTRIDLLQILQAKVPLNVYGIPEGIYRPDLLPESYTLEKFEIDPHSPPTGINGDKGNDGGDHDCASVMDADETPAHTNGKGSDPHPNGVDWVGDAEDSESNSGELRIVDDNQEVEAPAGSHPMVLEIEGITDPRQEILDRLPEATSLAEPKAELEGSDVITTFAGSFASRGQTHPDESVDAPPVSLPDTVEGAKVPEDPTGFGHGLGRSSGTANPLAVDDQLFQRVGVDLMQFRHAFLPIVFAEGFPAYPDGRPVWLRMDCEPEDVHRLFEQYLLMGQAGVRQLFLLENLGPHKLAALREFFYLYNWAVRSTAYDIFRVAEFRKIQSNRALEMEDDHYIKAQRLFDKAMMYMETQEFLDQLSPKAAIDLLKTVVAIQRQSVGLAANGAQSKSGDSSRNESAATSLEVTMRNVNPNRDGGGTGGSSSEIGTDGDGKPIYGAILGNPETTHLMQELIIKLNSPKA